jgi:hypothetical protein
MPFKIRPATLEEVDHASRILIDAANWLSQTGEMRWKPEQFSREMLEPLVNAGELQRLAYTLTRFALSLLYKALVVSARTARK